MKGIGILSIVFFGAIGIFGVKKMFDKKIGLKIDSHGITDNSNASSVGLIEWNDITGIRVEQVMSTKFIMVDVEDPEKYIQQAKNNIMAKILRLNLSRYGSPISITSNTLRYDFDELISELENRFNDNQTVD